MEQIYFCDNYCPIPARWVEFPKIDDELSVDCNLELSDCPFKDVDFSNVFVNEIDERVTGKP